eukprot:TRINITY_DN15788_c0_g1_i1.p3 TRINITY_DN15788_c0_g1~~TRINITY_DN15788_c0_g1_i1.p3  ORF type:complete len:214 (-),score=-16.78 TRINITY_DN15788_c0_g1_i1:185-826(-)
MYIKFLQMTDSSIFFGVLCNIQNIPLMNLSKEFLSSTYICVEIYLHNWVNQTLCSCANISLQYGLTVLLSRQIRIFYQQLMLQLEQQVTKNKQLQLQFICIMQVFFYQVQDIMYNLFLPQQHFVSVLQILHIQMQLYHNISFKKYWIYKYIRYSTGKLIVQLSLIVHFRWIVGQLERFGLPKFVSIMCILDHCRIQMYNSCFQSTDFQTKFAF